MILEWWRAAEGRMVKEYRCCGLIWQLILSRLYPARYHWRPTCPKCNEQAKE